MAQKFIKMHGLGNDFVMMDGRHISFELSSAQIRQIADRRYGVGCDQFIYLETPKDQEAHVFMRIFNADGTEVSACGNGTRCVGAWLTQQTGQPTHVIQTAVGKLEATTHPDQTVTVDMGSPALTWEAIPLATPVEDPLYLPLRVEGLEVPGAVSMGNPHLVFFTKSLDKIDLEKLGVQINHHPLFPKGTNVEVVDIQNRQEAQMRVYERGTGITPACATGACAVVVVAHHRGLMESPARIHLEGGTLEIIYDKTVQMRGPVHFSFAGQLGEPQAAA